MPIRFVAKTECARPRVQQLSRCLERCCARGRAHSVEMVGIGKQPDRQGLDDPEQLEFAVQEDRCLLTFNVGEFMVLHGEYMKSGRVHSDILVSAQKPVGRLLREILAFFGTHSTDEVRNQLFFL